MIVDGYAVHRSAEELEAVRGRHPNLTHREHDWHISAIGLGI